MLAVLAAERRGDSLADNTQPVPHRPFYSPSLPVPISWSSIARICAWADMFHASVRRANVVCESLHTAELLRTHAVSSSTARPPSRGSSTAAYFNPQEQLKFRYGPGSALNVESPTALWSHFFAVI